MVDSINEQTSFDINRIYFDPNYKASKREEKFKQILDSSRKIFAEYGYKKASIELVAKAVNLQKGSLYYYFKSKQELFYEVIRYESFVFINTVKQEVEKEKNVKDKLEKYFFLRVELLRKLKNIYCITENMLGDMFPFMLKLKKEHFVSEKSFIQDLLELGVKEEVFRIKDTEFTALLIMSALRGLDHMVILSDAYDLDHNSISNIIEILYNGILA